MGLSVEPWNAQADAAYSVKDPTIAMVDEYGMLTGVAPGETTLGVYVEALQRDPGGQYNGNSFHRQLVRLPVV